MNTSAACGTEFGCELISPSTPSARLGSACKQAWGTGDAQGPWAGKKLQHQGKQTPILIQHCREQSYLQAPKPTICMVHVFYCELSDGTIVILLL